MPRSVDAELDQALFVGRTSSDPATRKAAYATVQERFAAQLPYVWLYHARFVVAFDNQTFGVADQTLPDGTAAMPIINGAIRLTEVWRA
jgi:ABC-type transport system substrate-binding protein